MKIHILRHAKTDQNSSTGKDFDRKLLEKGIRQTKEMGLFFTKIELNPSHIFCSTAVRTRETLIRIEKQYPFNATINFRDDFYLCEKETLFSFLTSQKHNEEILIIGHNNGLSDFAAYLVDDFIDLKTCEFITVKFELDSWEEVSKGLGTIVDRFHPEV